MDERELVERVWKFLRRDPCELLGFDDAQAVELKGKIVANLDVFDEVTDWLPGMTLRDVGWKSVVMGVSDVLVKGAKPLGVMLGLGLPEELLDVADDLFIGIREACDDLGVHLWGGDTGSSDHLYIAVVAIGVADKLVARRGAKPGDLLMVASTGDGIETPVAYEVLLKGAPLCSKAHEAIRKAFRPRLVRAEFWLEITEYVTASIDDSDGFALSLHQLAESSGVKLVLDRVPMSSALVECAEAWGINPVEMALYAGGEEYSFIFTVPHKGEGEVIEKARKHGVRVWKIGRVEEGAGVYLRDYGEVEKRGWIHFATDQWSASPGATRR